MSDQRRTMTELDRWLYEYLREERGPSGTRAKVAELSKEVQNQREDERERHQEVMVRLENHEVRVGALELKSSGAWKWIGGVAASLIVAAIVAVVLRGGH